MSTNHLSFSLDGTGIDYWSVTIDRGSSLPLTTIDLLSALLEHGYFELATTRLRYYIDQCVLKHIGPLFMAQPTLWPPSSYVYENGTINMYTVSWDC